MSLWVLNLVVWTFGVRGHIPQGRDSGTGRDRSPAAASRTLVRVLTVCITGAALLLLTLWAAVWLTIQLL
jgi:hypothetical protein